MKVAPCNSMGGLGGLMLREINPTGKANTVPSHLRVESENTQQTGEYNNRLKDTENKPAVTTGIREGEGAI